MLAIGLPITLVIFWACLGLGVLSTLHKQLSPIQRILLAPVIGIVVILLPIFWLNRLGLPVGQFGVSLTLGLLISSILVLSLSRPAVPWRSYWPFIIVFLASMLLTGRPLLEFGFDWLSYANDDMANYCLAADRFRRYGFYDVNLKDLLENRDYPQFYWLLYAVDGVRPGSELLLAWLSSITGLTTHQVFMPLVLAFQIALISATGALVYVNAELGLAALMTCVLMASAALVSLGTLYQLIAQVVGLALLVACLTLCLRTFPTDWKQLGGQSLVVGAILSALFVAYPEVLPFLGLTVFLYFGLQLLQRKLVLQPLLVFGLAVLAWLLLFLNQFGIDVFSFLVYQISDKVALPDVTKQPFPHYLIPSGLPTLWGLRTLDMPLVEPWLSIGIILGALLLVTGIVATLALIPTGQPAVLANLTFLIAGVLLFSLRNAFGLFKLAMFIQPFMLATLSLAWTRAAQRIQWKVLPLLLVCLLGLPGLNHYVDRSRGGTGVGLVEVPNASGSRINHEFQQLIAATDSKQLLIDTTNMVVAKFQALYTVGKEVIFPSRDFWRIQGLLSRDLSSPRNQLLAQQMPSVANAQQYYRQEQFKLLDPQRPASTNAFTVMDAPSANASSRDRLFIRTTGTQSILNRWHDRTVSDRNFILQPWQDVRDRLLFVHSTLGNHYYDGVTGTISFYQLEPDWFDKSKTMSAIGRYFLFQAINPAAQPRLLLNLSTSIKGDGQNILPAASAIGVERLPFPIIGRGSARVFSPPLTPQVIAKTPYLGIDLNTDPMPFGRQAQGFLMSLYGSDISIDHRSFVAFGRDISLVSDAEYQDLTPPSQLNQFPEAFADPNLEYSGAYEDGWLSEAAFVQLAQPQGAAKLVIQGILPTFAETPTFTTTLQLLIDGKPVMQRVIKPGEFSFQVDVPPGQPKRRIDFRFSRWQSLLPPDNRPATIQLKFVGFVSAESATVPPSKLSQFPQDLQSPFFERSGLFLDGWLSDQVFVTLSQPQATAQLVLQGSIPQVADPGFTTEMQVWVDGVEVTRKTLKVGEFQVKAPVIPGNRVRRIELRFSHTQTLPPPDGRRALGQLKFVGFQ